MLERLLWRPKYQRICTQSTKNNNSSAYSAPEFCHKRVARVSEQLNPKESRSRSVQDVTVLFLRFFIRPALILLNVYCVVAFEVYVKSP